MNGNLGEDTVDSFLELIMAVFFIIFLCFATGQMIISMQKFTTHYHHSDKIEVHVNSDNIDENPFTYTGYQAYMFAWMMDPYSDVSLSWLATKNMKLDDDTNTHITISTIDDHGASHGSFMAYRNQLITGGTMSPDASVRSLIRGVHPDEVNALYASDKAKCGHYFQLEFGDFSRYPTVDYDEKGEKIVDERKVYSWVLYPTSTP